MDSVALTGTSITLDAKASDAIDAEWSTETPEPSPAPPNPMPASRSDAGVAVEGDDDYREFMSLFITCEPPPGGDGNKDNSDRDSGDRDEGSDKDEDSADDPDEGSACIFVKRIDARTITAIYVEESDTVDTVKTILKNKEGIPKFQQRLIKDDITLENGHTLHHYGIQDKTEIQLVPC